MIVIGYLAYLPFCALLLLLFVSCKKDELPSPEAKGRDLLYLSSEGKGRVYRDRNCLSRKYYVNFNKSEKPNEGVTAFVENVDSYDLTGKKVNRFVLAMSKPNEKFDFPFTGILNFEFDLTHPNQVDTVIGFGWMIEEGGQKYTYNVVNSFVTKNYVKTQEAILLEGDMEVVSLAWRFPAGVLAFDTLKKRTYHLLIDKEL